MIPLGGLASLPFALAGAISKGVQAGQQRKQGKQLREDAKKLRPLGIQDEYTDVYTGAKMDALSGMPQLDAIKEQQEAGLASQLRSIKEISPQGGVVADTVSAVLNKGNQSMADIGVKDAAYRETKRATAREKLWDIGNAKEKQRQDMLGRQEQMLTAASAFENAATVNQDAALNKGLGIVGATAGSFVDKLGMDAFGNKSTQPTSTSTPLSIPQATSSLVADVKLANKEAFDMANLLVKQGKAATQQEAMQYLRDLGFQF